MTPVTFVNARIAGGATSLRVAGGRIAGIGAAPQRHDHIVDLDGDRLLPGLINAHDHLQLNSLPALRARAHYTHVCQWISDINERRRTDAGFEASIAVPREQRLFLGGIKNLLCGVTTVAHHDPYYPGLSDESFPVAVQSRYGWSHSLDIDGATAVRRASKRTAADTPWIIHAAEGTDERAAAEFDRLDALGCLRPNTVLVHGVALRKTQRARLARTSAGLVWCPASNLRLFGATAAVGDLIARGQVALGSDSRLSGSRDLLAELALAARLHDLDETTLERLVTYDAARVLQLPDRGQLACGLRADLLVLPAEASLAATQRSQVRCVIIDGKFRYGDADRARQFSPLTAAWPIEVDGARKLLTASVAAQFDLATQGEPGVRILQRNRRVA